MPPNGSCPGEEIGALSSSLNILWFHNRGQFPSVVTKVYPEPSLPAKEFANLTRVHAFAAGQVPKPLHFGTHDSFWTVWMEGVPGFPIREYSESRIRLDSITQGLAAMHLALRESDSSNSSERCDRVVSRPLQTLAAFGASDSVREGCARLKTEVQNAWLDAQPIIPQHGDLFRSHILCHDDRFSVIDWETFGSIDIPFYDLLTLLFSLLRVDQGGSEEWDRGLVRQIPGLVARYAKTLSLPAKDVHFWLPLTLANWFHLQVCDGREAFGNRMYPAIRRYFENPYQWESIFIPGEGY
jgi:aminoglycoside phosphotransferase (APT) family kinase protein